MAQEIVNEIADGVSHLQIVPSLGLPGGESDHDSDEDDDGEHIPVVVGFVQKPEQPWCLSRQLFPSKAGGSPAWLDPVNIPRGSDICCGFCGRPLQFLVQVYAPIEANKEAFHRTLFLFMCSSMACLRQDQHHQMSMSAKKLIRSVKVFRCQLHRKNAYYSQDPPKNDGHDALISKGVSLCSWCNTWRGEKVCSGCKQARYCSRDHQLEHWRANHAACCRKVQEEVERQHTAWSSASNSLWPEFEIVDEEEGSIEQQTSTFGQMAVPLSRKEDGFSSQFQDVEPSKEQRHWANFEARLSRAPGQVLRYCRSGDAKPLWPKSDGKPDSSSIPVCPSCNGHRIFEFQILPQLLYFFGVSNEADSLDWATVAVYSCESSCTSSKAYVEEFVWVQLQ